MLAMTFSPFDAKDNPIFGQKGQKAFAKKSTENGN